MVDVPGWNVSELVGRTGYERYVYMIYYMNMCIYIHIYIYMIWYIQIYGCDSLYDTKDMMLSFYASGWAGDLWSFILYYHWSFWCYTRNFELGYLIFKRIHILWIPYHYLQILVLCTLLHVYWIILVNRTKRWRFTHCRQYHLFCPDLRVWWFL